MLTVACVLKSGGPLYDARWVARLRRNVARYAPPHRFVCLSDVDVPCERIPLIHGWPGWWSIIEVFRPGLFDGRVLYLDLADLAVWDLAPFFEGSGFIIAENPYRRLDTDSPFASGAMAFDAGDTGIYDAFVPQADAVMARLHGDQEWIAEMRPDAQTFSRKVCVSYKGDCRRQGRFPRGARIVFVHGQPKPLQIKDKWFKRRWNADWA